MTETHYNCGGKLIERGNKRVCMKCGEKVHSAVAAKQDVLRTLSKREDKAGQYASRLLETGGITDG